MANTLFVDNTTPIVASWLNDVNTAAYKGVPGALASLSYTDVNIAAQFAGGATTYEQVVLQNTNAGTTASADFIVSNNIGTASTYYGDFGINSSTFSGSGSFNLPNATYLSATSGDLVIGTTTNNAIHFVTNSGTTDAGSISAAGNATFNWLSPATGAVQRTFNAKLQETVSVLDFGADPTGGVASDTAFTNWAASLGGGLEGVIPSGTYLLSTGGIVIPSGATVRWLGSGAVINYTGTGACFVINSAKDITLHRPHIKLTNAGLSAVGVQVNGCWFLNIYAPKIEGNVTTIGSGNLQTGIQILSSQSSSPGFGVYMVEIHNPDMTVGVLKYGISTSNAGVDGTSPFVTHLSVYGGWTSQVYWPLYINYCGTFRVTGFTPEACQDGIWIGNKSHDGFLSPGEMDCAGYGINFADNTITNMSVVFPSLAGTATSGLMNLTNFTPNSITSGSITLLASDNSTGDNYNYTLGAAYSYGAAIVDKVDVSGSTSVLRSFNGNLGVNGQQIQSLGGISGTATASNNLRGTATFSTATTKAVAFATNEPDGSYFIALGGNAAGYCWVTSKATTGFTINCSASNSNTVDWILIR